jgi:hypothetical protein
MKVFGEEDNNDEADSESDEAQTSTLRNSTHETVEDEKFVPQTEIVLWVDWLGISFFVVGDGWEKRHYDTIDIIFGDLT